MRNHYILKFTYHYTNIHTFHMDNDMFNEITIQLLFSSKIMQIKPYRKLFISIKQLWIGDICWQIL